MDRDGISQGLLPPVPFLSPLFPAGGPRSLSPPHAVIPPVNPEAHRNAEFIVGVISAFRAEVSSLAGSLIDPRSIDLRGQSAWKGRLGTSHVLIVPGGMGPEKAADAARTLMTRGVSAVLCTGAAGALDPDLQVGDLILAEWVMEAKGEAGKSVCDPVWHTEAKRKAEQGGFRVTSGGVISIDEPASSPGEKRRPPKGIGRVGRGHGKRRRGSVGARNAVFVRPRHYR